MRRLIELLDKQYRVTVFNGPGTRRLQVEDHEPVIAGLSISDSGNQVIRFGDHTALLKMTVKGEWAFIRAFDRTFALRIIDPVEQAAQESGEGHGSTAKAPMPGTVVEVKVKDGDRVVKGQPMMIIESMKILTVISAPRDGVVAGIHFETGCTFDKNAVLVTLADVKEK